MASEEAEWSLARAEILGRTGGTCAACGKGCLIHVHHKFYESGKAKWDYPDDTLVPLCPTCHGKADEVRRKLCRAIGDLDSADSMQALGYMHGLALETMVISSVSTPPSYEYLEGLADAYGTTAEAVLRVAGRSTVVTRSMMRSISTRHQSVSRGRAGDSPCSPTEA